MRRRLSYQEIRRVLDLNLNKWINIYRLDNHYQSAATVSVDVEIDRAGAWRRGSAASRVI